MVVIRKWGENFREKGVKEGGFLIFYMNNV